MTFTVAPVIEDFKFDAKLQAGMRTRVYCNVAQGDPPLTISWFKNDQLLTNQLMLGLQVQDIDQYSKSLLMDQLTPEFNGNYTCQVSNEAAIVAHTAQLKVNGNEEKIQIAF